MDRKAFWCRPSTSKRPPGFSRAASRPSDTATRSASSATRARIFIGVSGWRYEPWRGNFYPEKLPQKRELQHAASIFNSIEINGSFYSLQRVQSWQSWYADVPADFIFAVKGPRYMTHMLKLRNVETPLANFLASGVLALKEKLGPILWQFPPQMGFDADQFEPFFAMLPRDTGAALAIAQHFEPRIMEGRTYLDIDTVRPMRHAVEIRHRSFLNERFIAMLRRNNVALAVAETAQRWPMPFDATADFVYIRLHGDKTLYQSGYGPKALERWAARIQSWRRGGEPAEVPKTAVRIGPPAALSPAGRDRKSVV